MWRPIETAPTDGTHIRLKRMYNGDIVADGEGFFGNVTIAYDEGPEEFRGLWVTGDGKYFFPAPTHWMPLLGMGGSETA